MARTGKTQQNIDYVRKAGMMLFIPFLLGACPAIGYFLGSLVDKIFHTQNVFSIIFIFLGLAAAARETYVIVRRASKDNEQSNNKQA